MATLTICTGRGCNTLTEEGQCRQCRADAIKIKSDRQGTATRRKYNYRWSQASSAWRELHPFCRQCEALGVGPTTADCTDHIIPHRLGEDLFWNKGNWQSLCTAHHAAKSGDESSLPLFTALPGRHVVTGPVCGGKSSYVRTHQGKVDWVWDMDLEAKRLGWASHQVRSVEQLRRLRETRARFIHQLSLNQDPCWVIIHNTRLACMVAAQLRAVVVVRSCGEAERQSRITAREIELGRSVPGRKDYWGLRMQDWESN